MKRTEGQVPDKPDVTRTRPLKRSMVTAVQEDLGDAAARVDELLAFLSELEVDAKGVNGLQARCRGWNQALTQMGEAMREESRDVAAKLLGEGPKIEARVNAELANDVSAARGGT